MFRRMLLTLAIVTLFTIPAMAQTSNIDLFNEIKNTVDSSKPSVMPVYDFIDHEVKQFVAFDIYRNGRISVPFGYLQDASISVAGRYEIFNGNQITSIPVLDSFTLAPTAGVGFVDFTNIMEKPSSLSKDNFSVTAGILGVKKF